MKVVAFKRELQGTGASRRLRKAGQTPGIIYGGTASPVAISLDHNALYHALKKEVFHASILDLELDGVVEKVLLRDFQVHAYKQLVLHADFQRVDANHKIHVKVPLHFMNADISPAVKLNSAVISHVMVDLEVSCLPAQLPEFIVADLAHLNAGESLHVKDIVLPEGVTAIVHGENPTVAIATIPAGATSAEAAAEVAPTAKPAEKK
ncbi:MAG: ribosomal protein L25/ral stress protein Ctc [Solimicrobium sp.]|jgi:large subunit ribosomal protein L25|nr:ribosomal protein L25/ral stress protein Ctc [Solimicrobium sp.]